MSFGQGIQIIMIYIVRCLDFKITEYDEIL